MKVLTVLGTRPEIIRLSQVIARLDESCEHIVVHTGQNYDQSLSDVFFRELRVRLPDESLGIRQAGFGAQVGELFSKIEPLLLKHRPDRLLVLGDTNSGLSAVVARRLGIPVYHMEAGNRCYDDRVPEEVNRRLIDHSSTVLMPYTERSRANLLREGIHSSSVFVTGNPIKEVLTTFEKEIGASIALETHGLTARNFFLVTMHRAENVDRRDRLADLVAGLSGLAGDFGMPVVCALHPRTKAKLENAGLSTAGQPALRFLPPLGLFDFVRLERAAACVLSDSGTVQEETCLFGVPNVTLREVTERPETVECGSNILAGTDPVTIRKAARAAMEKGGRWTPPVEYLAEGVSHTVRNIVTGFRAGDAAEAEWHAKLRA